MNVEETLARWGEGREAWNAWAADMLEKKVHLEEGGLWSADWFGEGENPETRAWLDAARADFSAQEFPEDVYFGEYVFPGPVIFDDAVFSGAAAFRSARFAALARFSGTRFLGAADFSHAVFEGQAIFEETEFAQGADFENVRFALNGGGPLAASARFPKAVFLGRCEFRGSIFAGNVEFAKARFAESARFDETRFQTGSGFQGAQFGGVASFSQAEFLGAGKFADALFAAESRFTKAVFADAASFEHTIFEEDASFTSTRFDGGAVFTGARFLKEARFREALFGNGADFSCVECIAAAGFDDARFGGTVNFSKARFADDIGFRRTQFAGAARFTETRFRGPAFFVNAHFGDDAAFQSIRSEVAFVLSGARFCVVPSFHEATFHQPPRLDYMDINEPLLRWRRWTENGPADPRPFLLRWMPVARDQHVSARYRQLRRMAADARDHEREHEFFAQEVRASRFWWDKPFGRGGAKFWLGWLYGGVSDFGRSMLRPMVLWVAAIFLFALYYLGQREAAAVPDTPAMVFPAWPHDPTFFKILAWIADLFVWLFEAIVNLYTSGGCFTGDSGATAEALYLSFKNAFFFLQWESAEAAGRVYGCLYGFKDGSAIVPLSVSAGAVVQNILCLTLLFLFLMALRNLLKVK